jgi:hypothetical protein
MLPDVSVRNSQLRAFSTIVVLALTVPFAACKTSSLAGGGTTDGGGTGTEIACDPLSPKPVMLGAIVGVGQDASGVLYMDSTTGVFVSESGTLFRQHVTGTGQSGTNEYLFTFESPSDDGSSARNLLVETRGSMASAMALGPPDLRAFLDQSPAGVTALTLVDVATVLGMAIVNTPNLISYVGDVANGDIVLATVPMSPDPMSSNGDLSIFYGPLGNVAQRAVTAFEQSRSGNGTVTFLVDGTPYVLAFGMIAAPDAGPLGAFALLGLTPQGGEQMAVTVRSPSPTLLPSGLSFTCLP